MAVMAGMAVLARKASADPREKLGPLVRKVPLAKPARVASAEKLAPKVP